MSRNFCFIVLITLSLVSTMVMAGGLHHISHAFEDHGFIGAINGHDSKTTQAVSGPSYIVRGVHHISKIQGGGGHLGHYSSKHGHGR